MLEWKLCLKSKAVPHQDGGSDCHLSRGRLNVGVQRIKGSIFLPRPTSLIWQIFPDGYCSMRVFMLKLCKRKLKFLANFIGCQVINTHLDMFLSSGTTISYFTINLAFTLTQQNLLYLSGHNPK